MKKIKGGVIKWLVTGMKAALLSPFVIVAMAMGIIAALATIAIKKLKGKQ